MYIWQKSGGHVQKWRWTPPQQLSQRNTFTNCDTYHEPYTLYAQSTNSGKHGQLFLTHKLSTEDLSVPSSLSVHQQSFVLKQYQFSDACYGKAWCYEPNRITVYCLCKHRTVSPVSNGHYTAVLIILLEHLHSIL